MVHGSEVNHTLQDTQQFEMIIAVYHILILCLNR